MTVANISPCYAFKIPPRKGGQGYRYVHSFSRRALSLSCMRAALTAPLSLCPRTPRSAAEWKQHKVWEGRCQVVTRGDEIGVRLAENDGGTFAEAPVEKFAAPFVEAVVDSGRYFALRIVNAGRFAFVGIGFQERGHALSFKIALQEHFKREAEPEVAAPVPVATGKYKLAAGSSIGSIAIAGVGGKTKKKKKKK